MELLAPAGSLDVFQAAIDCGANAVYIGAPTANARALARHFTLEEIAAMTDYAHQHGVKLYVAMNSLIKEEELPAIIRLLSVLAGINVDAIIIQDFGIYHLARSYFPTLRLHASTLMGAHNSNNVRQFADMGFKRVVLAREMRLQEIAVTCASSPVEIEVFIHGAMCFAYSGLCLFSSFLGGKSGLRGRCVQPCRRKYSWQGSGAKGGGYLFSMNDLEGISLLPELQKAGITSLKIEGRMRSRQYVGAVVKAYRLALDQPNNAEAMAEAKEILSMAMGRKTSTGYFLQPSPALVPSASPDLKILVASREEAKQSLHESTSDNALITHQYSGNIGLFIGKLTKRKQGGKAELTLREPLAVGDRIRIHNEKSGDRDSLTLKELWLAGKTVTTATAGQTIQLMATESAKAGDPVYKVDTIESRQDAAKMKGLSPQDFKIQIANELRRERIQSITASLIGRTKAQGSGRPLADKTVSVGRSVTPRHEGRKKSEVKAVEQTLPWWVKIDDFQILKHLPRHKQPVRIIVLLTKDTLRQVKRVSLSADQRRGLIWALPPIILEPDLPFYRQNVPLLVQQGFQDWQLSHIGQRQLFREEPINASPADENTNQRERPGKVSKRPDRNRRMKITFYGHYSLNIINSQALRTLAECGINSAQVAIEVDKELLADITDNKSGPLGMTVYGYPPLFTARPSPDFFAYDQKFISPKGEGFVLKKSFEQTLAIPTQPFSLLDRLHELKSAGLDYVVIDLSNNLFKRGDLDLLWRRLDGGHSQDRLSNFNYRGTLQ
ncbi:MAG: U32 family peptidase [Desulfobulbaceae bacterium]|nr:U32 family peptidase [Desulfobulbaceae bacterium]